VGVCEWEGRGRRSPRQSLSFAYTLRPRLSSTHRPSPAETEISSSKSIAPLILSPARGSHECPCFDSHAPWARERLCFREQRSETPANCEISDRPSCAEGGTTPPLRNLAPQTLRYVASLLIRLCLPSGCGAPPHSACECCFGPPRGGRAELYLNLNRARAIYCPRIYSNNIHSNDIFTNPAAVHCKLITRRAT
jgi:hypothetical protein